MSHGALNVMPNNGAAAATVRPAANEAEARNMVAPATLAGRNRHLQEVQVQVQVQVQVPALGAQRSERIRLV